MRPIAPIALCLALTACTSQSVPMLNPATGQRAECGSHVELWLLNLEFIPAQEMTCQRDYESQGWVRSPG